MRRKVVKKNNKQFREKIKKYIKNITKDKTLTVLFGILIVLTLVIITLKITTINHLDTESELVTSLHNYFNSEDLGNCEGLFTYAEEKIDYKKVDAETRLCLAYQKADIKNTETGTIKADKKKDICTMDDMVFRITEDTKECSYTKIDKKIIDDSYKKLYGKEIEKNKSFKIDNLNICYLKDDHYYCGLSETFTYTLGNESVIYRVMEKAVEKGRDIVIYDYFAKINDNSCFKAYTTVTLNKECTDNIKNQKDINYKFMKNYGTHYKHVFRKAKDDTYYWVSSEPIK